MESVLERAISYALQHHQGQTHEFGTPYILHPLRVMDNVRQAGGSETATAVAVLHDVVEDTDATVGDLQCVFGELIAGCVAILTRRDEESYEAYISRIAHNPHNRITCMVKQADLADNLYLGRIHPLPAARQTKLTRRYRWAKAYLRTHGAKEAPIVE